MSNFEEGIVIRDPTGQFKILRGGKLYDWEPPTTKPLVTPSKLVEEILKKSGIVVEENLKARLTEIVEAYQKDVRDKFETRNTLTRAVEAGGMGFAAEQADLVIKLIEVEKEKGLKVREVEAAEEVVVPKVAAAPPTVPPPSVVPSAVPPPVASTPVAAKVLEPPKPALKVLPSAMATALTPVPVVPVGVAEFVFSPADEAEILAHAQKLPAILAGFKPIEVAKFIDEIIKKSGVVLDEANRKKLESILLVHLKDIRDGFETKETLSRVAEPTGLILTVEQVEKILTVAREKLQELAEKLKKEEVKKTKKAIEEEKLKTEKARQEAEEKVKRKINERWQEITKRGAPKVAMPTELISPPIGLRAKVSVVAPPTPPSVLSVPVSPPAVSVPEEKIEKKKSLMMEKKKMTAPAAVGAVLRGMVGVAEEKPKPLQVFKPAAPVRRPVPREVGKPRLDDIKYVPKLVGPIEELREMTLVDFRHLSSDPKMAAVKVKEKIDLLEKESISKKIAGIKAWQESEVSQLYLEISRESLTKGVPASQVISLRTSAGKPTLSLDEYQAVMELNRSLRY